MGKLLSLFPTSDLLYIISSCFSPQTNYVKELRSLSLVSQVKRACFRKSHVHISMCARPDVFSLVVVSLLLLLFSLLDSSALAFVFPSLHFKFISELFFCFVPPQPHSFSLPFSSLFHFCVIIAHSSEAPSFFPHLFLLSPLSLS